MLRSGASNYLWSYRELRCRQSSFRHETGIVGDHSPGRYLHHLEGGDGSRCQLDGLERFPGRGEFASTTATLVGQLRSFFIAAVQMASNHSWVLSLAATLASKRPGLPTMAAKFSNINTAGDFAEGT